MSTPSIDIETLRGWIGRSESASDVITPRLVQRLNATLNRDAVVPESGAVVPATTHWCLAPATVPMSGVGVDGHPARGGFLPPVPLPRRMWAGGSLVYHGDFRVGDEVERVSKIVDVTMKEGRSGVLCFVTVEHRLSSARGLAIVERQDIVYRDAEAPAPAKPAAAATPAAQPAPPPPAVESVLQWSFQATPVLLFRYSALTFNGHRIHYDRDYATQEEGYPGLLVHGPLQATILMELATAAKGSVPRQFDFRGVSPLFDGEEFTATAVAAEDGLDLFVSDSKGRKTMTAKATW
jgi:3-methylfumaryl-CoA hydratase